MFSRSVLIARNLFCSRTTLSADLSQVKYCGGYISVVPPLPIPNREVKHTGADGTATPSGRVGSCRFSNARLEIPAGHSHFMPVGIKPASAACGRQPYPKPLPRKGLGRFAPKGVLLRSCVSLPPYVAPPDGGLAPLGEQDFKDNFAQNDARRWNCKNKFTSDDLLKRKISRPENRLVFFALKSRNQLNSCSEEVIDNLVYTSNHPVSIGRGDFV